MTGVPIAVAYWRRRSSGRKRGRPGGTTAPCHGRPYEGWKMFSDLQTGVCYADQGSAIHADPIDRCPLRSREGITKAAQRKSQI